MNWVIYWRSPKWLEIASFVCFISQISSLCPLVMLMRYPLKTKKKKKNHGAWNVYFTNIRTSRRDWASRGSKIIISICHPCGRKDTCFRLRSGRKSNAAEMQCMRARDITCQTHLHAIVTFVLFSHYPEASHVANATIIRRIISRCCIGTCVCNIPKPLGISRDFCVYEHINANCFISRGRNKSIIDCHKCHVDESKYR